MKKSVCLSVVFMFFLCSSQVLAEINEAKVKKMIEKASSLIVVGEEVKQQLDKVDGEVDDLVEKVFNKIDSSLASMEKKADGLIEYRNRFSREAKYVFDLYSSKLDEIKSGQPCQDKKPSCEGMKKALYEEYENQLKVEFNKLKPKLSEALKIAGRGESEDRKSTYYFYAGSLNNLNNDGDFESHGEFAFATESVRADNGNNDRNITSMDLTFTHIAQQESSDDGTGIVVTSPFTKDSGIVRYQGMYEGLYSSNMGFIFGLGFTSLPSADIDSPSDKFSFTQLRGKLFAGASFRNSYTGGGKGRLFIAYAYDDFWRWTSQADDNGTITQKTNDFRDRVLLDARLTLPQAFESESAELMLKAVFDYSLDSDGPSDVRVSLLLSVDLDEFFK